MSDLPQSVPVVMPAVPLHSGEALSFARIDYVTRQRYTPIIFVTGEIRSGKTTLLGSIHDEFQFCPIGEYLFAGSETLLALEERCYESRARSGRTKADTPRTQYQSGLEYIHFRTRKQEEGATFKDILFADMSGEFYERANLQSSELSELRILSRSDYLILLLDGRKLLNLDDRPKVRADALHFIRRCLESGLLLETTKLQILISKWDVVLGARKEEAQQVLEYVTSQCNESRLLRQVQVVPVAARPDPESDVPKLFGVKELFAEWLECVAPPLRVRTSALEMPHATKVFNRSRAVHA